jgi:hypothetical protein
MRKPIITAIVGGILLLAASVYFSPHVIVYQMEQAIKKRDYASFSRHVDFPALRANFKGRIMSTMRKQLTTPDSKDNSLAALGQSMAEALSGPVLGTLVTPEGVAAMMSEGSPKSSITDAAKGMPVKPAPAEAGNSKSLDFAVSYKGWNTVLVTNPDAAKAEGGFIFTRNGLWNWKLSAVDLPESTAK